MSKVIRTGTIYRMVGFLVMAVIALAIAVPTIASMFLTKVKQQDAEVAARPVANAPAAAAPIAQPIAAPQAPVVFGAPTMPAAPVDYAKLQQPSQNTPVQNEPNSASETPGPALNAPLPSPSPDLGVDPNVTAPRVIPPSPSPKTAEKPRNLQRVPVY
jgi:hypothetical protein